MAPDADAIGFYGVPITSGATLTPLWRRQLVDLERIDVGSARSLGQSEQLCGERSHWHRRRTILRHVHHRIQVLQHGRDMTERWRMDALDHPRHEELQRDGIGKAAR